MATSAAWILFGKNAETSFVYVTMIFLRFTTLILIKINLEQFKENPETHTHTPTPTFSSRGILELQIHLTAGFAEVEGTQITQRKPTQRGKEV